jgi:NAD(P)-dependent dehydrogenase (short-subunit alcohol dehydrogenase family)
MTLDPMPQVALVTGASSGFGLLAAVSLARHGLRVVASMRDLARRGELDQAAAAAGVSLQVIALDVTRPDTFDQALAQVGPVGVLVNNAGVGIVGAVENISMEEVRQTFETNFFGAVALIKAVLPGMRERRAGRIVNVSSIAARIASPGTPAYIASKYALEGLSDALRYEVHPFGITVSIIQPGTFPTAMTKAPWMASRSGGAYEGVERAVESMLKASHARKPADPQRVADAIVHAATARSPRRRYVVGSDARFALVVRSLLPTGAFEALIRSMLKPRSPPKQIT